VPVNRCPNATVKPEHLQLINAALLAEKGVLQDAGGWLDQSCTFATVFPLLCGEIAHWREVATKAAMDKSKSKRR
jgi:hypothetical protein